MNRGVRRVSHDDSLLGDVVFSHTPCVRGGNQCDRNRREGLVHEMLEMLRVTLGAQVGRNVEGEPS